MLIIDSHIHLYDPFRPEGVPWPAKTDVVLYKSTLPERYEAVTEGFDIRGAIAIECSPWESDNDWLLEIAEKSPMIVGIIGNLVPGSPSFCKSLERLAANPLFRGIRYGNLWGRSLSADMNKPGFVEDLKALSDARLVLESANPDMELISALVRIKDEVPKLTVIIDHLPNAQIAADDQTQKKHIANLKQLGDAPHVFVKLSEIPARVNNQVMLEPGFYKQKLDMLWDIFGEDRVLFGSDWPNSDHVAGYAETLGLVRQYVATKGDGAAAKFFQSNSVAAYRWKPRRATQLSL